MDQSSQRWHEAFRLLGRLERGRPRLRRARRPVQYRVSERAALRLESSSAGLPEPTRALAGGTSSGPLLDAPCRAEFICLGKFDVEAAVRLRAFYLGDERPFTLALQPYGGVRQHGLARAVRARRLVARHLPGLAAPLYGHGRLRSSGAAFLREGIVQGRHPTDRIEMQEVAGPIAEALHRFHVAIGIARWPLSRAATHTLPQGWETFARQSHVSQQLNRRVRRLIQRDAFLEVSLGHGDLVGSNILLTSTEGSDQIVLLDWEHARPLPVVFDLAKLHLSARAPDVVLRQLHAVLDDELAHTAGGYGLEEQLALAHVQMLAWHEHRYAKAARAGRLRFLRRDTDRRLELIEQLLG